MRTAHETWPRPRAAEGEFVVSIRIISVDAITTVTIRHENRSVLSGCNVRGNVFIGGLVMSGLIRASALPDRLPIQSGLYQFMAIRIAQVEELIGTFFRQMHSVRSPAELLTPRGDKLSVLVEDHDGIARLTCRVNGVLDVDAALGILDDTVGVAIGNGTGQLSPIVDAFVLMLPLSDDNSFSEGVQRGGGRSFGYIIFHFMDLWMDIHFPIGSVNVVMGCLIYSIFCAYVP